MPYEVDTTPEREGGLITVTADPIDSSETKAAEEKIISFLEDGWEIISTVPVSTSYSYAKGNQMFFCAFTKGIEVFLIKKT